jgi:hypothetical protein
MAGSGTCINVLDGVVLVTAVSRDNERADPVLCESTCSQHFVAGAVHSLLTGKAIRGSAGGENFLGFQEGAGEFHHLVVQL